MTRLLVTTANGDTGRPMVEYLLESGLQVRAMVRKDDARAQRLRDAGAEVVFGDLLTFRDVRAALEDVQRAYFNFPVGEGLVEAAVMFAQAAKEECLELIVNMPHIQSRPQARSKATQNHWLSEQIFGWSGVPTTNLRVTFFMEWLTYIAGLIRYGRYVMPFDADSRFAPIAGRDIALTGPVEYSHRELAAEVSRVLAKDLPFEQATVTTFLDLIGIPDDTAKLRHFEAVTIDRQEGRLAGVSNAAPTIIGRHLRTVEDFINEHRSLFELEYATTTI